MRKVREILRLSWQVGLKDRQIARSLNISHSTVGELLRRAREANLSWPLSDDLDDGKLEALLYPEPAPEPVPYYPDMNYIHRELRSRKHHVTLMLLWQEYKANNPAGLQYSQFCERYRQWRNDVDICMRQEHRAGEKMFVDFAGDKMPVVINRETGEVRDAEIFVATLGASNYTFITGCWSQELPDWIDCHSQAYAYFDGVSEVLVPDNLRSGVKHACFYEPEINPTYLEMAQYYGTVVIPARTYRPKYKAKVENAVLQVERSILAALRKRTFFGLYELNQALAEELEKFNNRPFQKLPGTRRSHYEDLDKPALKPLPSKPYEFGVWKKVRANIDYHVEIDEHYYSIPYQLRNEEHDVRITAHTIEIFNKGKRIASHTRLTGQKRSSTNTEHMPSFHKVYAEWNPQRLIKWATSIGPNTGELVKAILDSWSHPEQGFRSCLGIFNLAKKYGNDRVDAACKRALTIKSISYRSIRSILETRLDHAPLPITVTKAPLPMEHENLRGSSYYAKEAH